MFSSTKTSAFSCADGIQAWFGLSALGIMVSECCAERYQAMNYVWTWQQICRCFSPVVFHQTRSGHIILACDSVCCHVLLLFFQFRSFSFCGQHLWSLVFYRRSSGIHYTRGMMLLRSWCFWFCFISQKREIGSKALMTLSIIPNTLQVILQRCRDVVAPFFHTLLWYIYVVGGDGYPRWYESVGKFFQQQFLLHYWNVESISTITGGGNRGGRFNLCHYMNFYHL